MKPLLFSFLCFCCYNTLFAQDNDIRYFNKNWKPVEKEQAYYYSIVLKENDGWKRNDFIMASKRTVKTERFSDEVLKTKEGLSTSYYENGKLKDSVLFEAGKRKAGWYFYESGKLKAAATFESGKISDQKGWDEDGHEIKDFVVEKPASFPGGAKGWKKYLETSLNASVPMQDKSPVGTYTVKVRFTVDEQGAIHDVRAGNAVPLCPSCVVEAIRVITTGPKWLPAIQFGKPVTFKAVQPISFFVSNNFYNN